MKRYISILAISLSWIFNLFAQNTDEYISLLPDVSETELHQGHAYTVGLQKNINAPTTDRQRMHMLFLSDTLTVHLKLGSFNFHSEFGLSMPQADCAINFVMYDVSDYLRHEIFQSPFRVDGNTMRTYISQHYERQDSVVLTLAPGRYLLEYNGYNESLDFFLPQGITENNPIDGDMIISGPYSSISLVLECIPLAVAPVPVVTSYSHVVTKVRRELPDLEHFFIEDGGVMTTTTWLDDFGREVSTHQVGATPQHNTLVDYKTYDAAGRQSRMWLGTSMQIDGGDSFIARDFVGHSAQTQYGDLAPYSETFYENASILDRKSGECGPGLAWRLLNRAVNTEYLSNSNSNAKLKCKQLAASPSGQYDTTVTICSRGLFPAGTLKVVSVTDEDGRETLVFVDRFGRNILQRQVLSGTGLADQYLDTYYIYDALDHLIAVVPPGLEPHVTDLGTPDVEVDRYAYLYIYDGWERLVGKKLPGCAWVRMAYDKADRLVFSQDGRQRAQGKSTFYLYDIYGRECVRGLCSKNIEIGENVASFVRAEYHGNSGSLLAYDYSGVSLNSPMIMTVSFYDSYDFLEDFVTNLPGQTALYGESVPATTGKVTGSVMYPLSPVASTPDEVWSLIRYDNRGRTSHVETSYRSSNGYEVEDFEYDLVGNTTKRRIEHKYSQTSAPITELYTYSYDHAERLCEVKHRLNNGSEKLLARNSYDEFGRLSTTEHGVSSNLTMQYSYNVRSWITSMSCPLFEQTLHYNIPRSGSLIGSNAMFGGSVSSMEYKSAGDIRTRSYDYGYDGLGRLVRARYADGQSNGSYDANYSYDVMGNILSVSRRNGSVSTLLFYNYDGNRLMSPYVAMNDDYEYDVNGNMLHDAAKGVSFSYNVINLPSRIFKEGQMYALPSYSDYTYLPDGTLLSIENCAFGRPGNMTSHVKEYRGNAVYYDNAMKYILFDGGLIDMTGAAPDYQFFICDHLGSTRVVASAAGQALQSNEYYPFGGMIVRNVPDSSHFDIDDSGVNPLADDFLNEEHFAEDDVISLAHSDQPYKFSGKEFIEDNGLNLYNFGARFYNPVNCRFITMDPLAEKYFSISPYAYCNNNPVIFVDPDGKFIRKLYPDKIVISASIKTNEYSKESLMNAISFWNNSENYTYMGKPLRFDISYEVIEPLQNNGEHTYEVSSKKMKEYNREKHPSGNVIATGYNNADNGSIIDDAFAITFPGTDKLSSTGAHEIGHQLGMHHYDAEDNIMSPSQEKGRSNNISQKNISEMMKSHKGDTDYSGLFLFVAEPIVF